MGDDESVIHCRRGRLNIPQISRRQLDGIQLAGLIEDVCHKLEATGGMINGIVIERDGPGTSAWP